MLSSLFKPSPLHAAGLRLLAAVSTVARQPGLFGDGRIPDTMAGRFEAMALIGSLAILRLCKSPEAERVAQVFVDLYFKHLEAGLREAGVGDLSVPKKMKAIAGAVYGRLAAYEAALEAGDRTALTEALTRNVFSGSPSPFAPQLSDYVTTLWTALVAAPPQALEAPETWPLRSA